MRAYQAYIAAAMMYSIASGGLFPYNLISSLGLR